MWTKNNESIFVNDNIVYLPIGDIVTESLTETHLALWKKLVLVKVTRSIYFWNSVSTTDVNIRSLIAKIMWMKSNETIQVWEHCMFTNWGGEYCNWLHDRDITSNPRQHNYLFVEISIHPQVLSKGDHY
jgi:hypothetical protein